MKKKMFFLRRLNPRRTFIFSMLIFTFILNCCIFWSVKNHVFYTSDNNKNGDNKEMINFKKYGKKFCVLYDFWKSSEEYFSGNLHITLILHSTVNFLSYLKEQDKTWNGGISFALYIPTYNDSFIFDAVSETMLKLELLKKQINSTKIRLHLFYQTSTQRSCLQNVLKNDKKLQYELPESRYTYPINVARNIGRKGSGTNFFISGDIEQLYVKGFEPKMLKLANKILLKNKTRTVLVHRRFELQNNVTIPTKKNELKKLFDKGFAIPFHERLYSLGHFIPNLPKWMKSNESNDDDISITQILEYGNEAWEPQFVADSRIPFHDERFPYRYRSNAHLSNLLCMHNFTFSIVSDVFSIHRGITAELAPTKLEIYNRLKILGVDRMNAKFFRELQKISPKKFKFCFKNL